MLNVRTNVGSINAQRNIFSNNMQLSKSMEKLSSGFRINRAGDDAAGLAISEKLKAQIGGLNQAARNSLDGVSMIQTAEAGLDEVQSMMHRIRDLSVQGANDTLGTTERDAINQEVQQLALEITNISNRTKFNTQGLLNGSLVTALTAGAGGGTAAPGTQLNTGSVASVSAVDVRTAGAGKTFTFTAAGTNLTLSDGTNSQIIDTAAFASIAANGSFTYNFANLGVSITVSAGAAVKTQANTLTDLNAKTLITAAGNATATLQTGAYAGDTTAVAFLDTRLTSATADANIIALNTAIGNYNTTRSQANASALITAVDNGLNYISSQRAILGASQNRLEHTIANVKNAAENLSASHSRIRDVDVAEESANLSKYQILVQASTAMLAQANQMPQLALKLLS